MSEAPSSLLFRLKRLVQLKFLTEGLNRILGLLFFLMLSRFLGTHGYGEYSFALATALLVSHLCFDFGFNTYIVREISKAPERLSFLLKHVLAFRAIVSLFILVCGALWADALLLGALVMLLGLGWIDTLCAFYHGLETLEYEVKLRTFQRAMSLVCAAGVLLYAPSVLSVIWASAFATWLALLIFGFKGPLKMNWVSGFEFPVFFSDIKGALPFWFTVAFFVLYTRLDIFMLGILGRPETEIGAYQAAIKVLDLLNLFPQLAALAIFPVLQRLTSQHLAALKDLVGYVLLWSFQLALPLGVGGYFLAEPLLLFILGKQYQATVPAFSILLWSLLFNFHNFFLFYVLAVLKRENWGIFSSALGLVSNVLLNLWLIPSFGHLGAASSTVFTEAAVWLCNLGVVFVILKPSIRGSLYVKSLLALGAMASFLWVVKDTDGWVLWMGIAASLYLMILFGIKALGSPDELKALMKSRV